MVVNKGRKSPVVFRCHAVSPNRLEENLLKHQRVHINQANLEKMERKDGKLLIFEPVCRRHPTALTIENVWFITMFFHVTQPVWSVVKRGVKIF